MFISPTKGKLELEEMVADIMDYMGEDSRFRYRLIIGTDSQVAKGVDPVEDFGCLRHLALSKAKRLPKCFYGVDFVNAVVIHRIGKGGRYFWRRIHREYSTRLTLKARIFTEANLSIELSVELLQFMQKHLAQAFIDLIPQVEVHIDVGQNGPTREMIKELVGLVRANGFEARIKPEAYAASTVADKYA